MFLFHNIWCYSVWHVLKEKKNWIDICESVLCVCMRIYIRRRKPKQREKKKCGELFLENVTEFLERCFSTKELQLDCQIMSTIMLHHTP